MAMTTATTRSYVLACETPMLEDEEELCPFLKALDEEEHRFLERDLKKEETRMEVWKKGPLANGVILSGVGVICAFVSFFYNSRRRDEDTRVNEEPTNHTKALIAAAASVITFVFGIVGPSRSKTEMKAKLDSDIIGERICRIQNKIRKIDTALQGNLLEVDRDQILKVKDYFNLKLSEMMAEKTNVINVR